MSKSVLMKKKPLGIVLALVLVLALLGGTIPTLATEAMAPATATVGSEALSLESAGEIASSEGTLTSLGSEPQIFAASAGTDDEGMVYMSVCEDGRYLSSPITGQTMAYVGVPLAEVEAINLEEYGEGNYLYDADGDGEYETTLLSLFIYVMENYYESGSWDSVDLVGNPGSTFISGGFWGIDSYNLTYFLNGEFPLEYPGWGTTSDKMVLSEGDFCDLSVYTDYSFYTDANGGFHYFRDAEGGITHSYDVQAGESLEVWLGRTQLEVDEQYNPYGTYLVDPVEGKSIYYGTDYSYSATPSDIQADANGKASITFDEPGTYYIWANGGEGAYTNAIVSSPAFAVVTVTDAGVPVEPVDITTMLLKDYELEGGAIPTPAFNYARNSTVRQAFAYIGNSLSETAFSFTLPAGVTVEYGGETIQADSQGRYTLPIAVTSDADSGLYLPNYISGTGGQSITFTLYAGEESQEYRINMATMGTMQTGFNVIDYLCIGSQYTNTGSYGLYPERLYFDQLLSLGNYGGYITLEFDEAIINDPTNLYGVDFMLYGNSMTVSGTGSTSGFAEPGNVLVSNDNINWYALAGSDYFDDHTVWDFEVTYSEGTSSKINWEDQNGNNGTMTLGTHPPQESNYPMASFDQNNPITVSGSFLFNDTKDPYGSNQARNPAWGYVDVSTNGTIGAAVNPYARLSSGSGDGYDISWAVDSDGNPVKLDSIKYVKVQTASLIDGGAIGEKSTEIQAIRVATSSGSATGTTAAPTTITINGSELELEADVLTYTVPVSEDELSIEVETGGSANVYINNQYGGTASFESIPDKGIVRVLVQEDAKQPLIYYLTLTDADALEPPVLTGLTVDSEAVSGFASDVYSYDVTVTATSTTIIADYDDETYQLTVDDVDYASGSEIAVTLAEGRNSIALSMTDKNNEENTAVYTLEVLRPRTATLSNLDATTTATLVDMPLLNSREEGTRIRTGTAASTTTYSATVKDYSMYFLSEVDSVTFTSTPTVATSYVRVIMDEEILYSGNSVEGLEIPIAVGDNLIEIEVCSAETYDEYEGFMAEDKYILNIKRVQLTYEQLDAAKIDTMTITGISNPDYFVLVEGTSQYLSIPEEDTPITYTITVPEGVKLYKSATSTTAANTLTPVDGVYTLDVVAHTPYIPALLVGYTTLFASALEIDGVTVKYLYGYMYSVGGTNGHAGGPDSVVDYLVPASQYTNKASYGMAPERVLMGYVTSLGNFGGYMTVKYDEPITNDSTHPYGLDFTVYGNPVSASGGYSEPGNVWVSKDGDEWYLLAGSDYFDDNTIRDYEITYYKASDGSADFTDNKTNLTLQDPGTMFNYPLPSNYSLHNWQPGEDEQMTLSGPLLTSSAIDPYGSLSAANPDWGYVDVHKGGSGGTNAAAEELPFGNPYLNSTTTNYGDGFDISWAIDGEGNPVELDEISYIKVSTASIIFAGAIGEKSTEISAFRRAPSADEAVGVTADPTAIKVNGESIDLESDVYSYTVDFGEDGVDVEVEGTGDATVYINNTKGVSRSYDSAPTSGVIRIIVQGGEMEPVIYYLNDGEVEPEPIPTSIEVNGETLEMKTGSVTTYNVSVKNNTALTVKVTAEDDANVFINSVSGRETTFESGSIPATIRIMVQRGTEAAYQYFLYVSVVSEEGYEVTLLSDQTVAYGNTVNAAVSIDSDVEEGFNALDITLTYDDTVLEFDSLVEEGYEVDSSTPGEVRVYGYGDERELGDAFTAQFKAIGLTDEEGTEIALGSAKIDKSDNAIGSDAPEARQAVGSITVVVSGYSVTLGENLTGSAFAMPGEDYTFRAEDWNNYDYTISATVGGITSSLVDNGDGTYTIPAANVTGSIVVTVDSRTAKSYSVTFDGSGASDATGADTATYNTDYSFTLAEAEGYSYEVTIMVGGEAYTGFSASEGTYTIPGTDITGSIAITIAKTLIPPESVNVTFEGTGVGDAIGDATAAYKEAYTFSVAKAEGYEYAVSATVGGAEITITDNGDGTYTVAADDVTDNIVITVEKTAELEVAVYEYVKLDNASMFLVLASGEVSDGSTYAYDGNAMYWSEKYDAYAYLVIAEEAFDAEAAAAKIAIVKGEVTSITYNGDVNETGLVDINDAQLVYDAYNAKYGSFEDMSMTKFLKGDLNGDYALTVQDAAAVVAIILG